MPISAPPPSWTSIKNKPTTVGGFGITDMASQSVASATSAAAVPWSGVSSKPTTVSGFGITDLASNAVTSINGQTGAVTDTALYAIGSYVTGRPANTTAYAVNTTIAGSSLYATPTTAAYSGSWTDLATGLTPSTSLVNVGTWRCVSPAVAQSAVGSVGLWVRIS